MYIFSPRISHCFISLIVVFIFLSIAGCQHKNDNTELAKKVAELEKKIAENNTPPNQPSTDIEPTEPSPVPTTPPRVDTVFVDKPCPPETMQQHVSIFLQPSKMNVFYIGVENPILISGQFNLNDLRVAGIGAGINIKRAGSKAYNVTVNKPGEGRIEATVNGRKMVYPFRAKRMPDPVARVSNSPGGSMGSGEFKAQGGVTAILDNFDFDVRCQIQGFTLTYIAKRQDPIESINRGPRYNAKSKRLINRARPGDTYLFTNVKAKCPGDNAGRRINTIAIQIQ